MPRYLFGFIILAILFTDHSARSQSLQPTPGPAPSASPTLEREFFKNILRDQKAIWTAPVHAGRSDLKWIVPGSIGVTALITTDRITGDEMAESNRLVQASRIVSHAGAGYTLAGVAATFYLVGRQQHNQRARETGILSGEAFLDSVIVGNALKAVTQRVRPQEGVDRSEFFDGGSSFPSGHSIQVWSVATVIASEYHRKPLVQIAAYGTASAVSVARFTGHKHYLSDVLVGSALGFGIGRYVYHAHHRQNDSDSDGSAFRPESKWPAIATTFNHHVHRYGLALTWSF
jgi:membrane-associated phospholipid phosphatase